MKNINSICKKVLKVSEEELEEAFEIIEGQKDYSHPLKPATAARVNETGRKNQKVLEAFLNLRNVLKENNP